MSKSARNKANRQKRYEDQVKNFVKSLGSDDPRFVVITFPSVKTNWPKEQNQKGAA